MSFFTQVKITGNIGGLLDAVLGAAKPANVLQVGGNDGTNSYAVPLSSGGTASLVTGLGSAGSATAGVVTIQGISSMTPVAIAGASGSFLDQAAGSAKRTNSLQVGGNDGTNQYALPLTSLGVSVLMTPGAPTVSKYSQAAITFSASGDNTLVAGSGSTTIRVYRIFFVNSDAATSSNITIKDSTPTNFSGAFLLASGGAFGADGQGDPLFVGAAGKGFQLNSSAAVQISGTIWYTQS